MDLPRNAPTPTPELAESTSLEPRSRRPGDAPTRPISGTVSLTPANYAKQMPRDACPDNRKYARCPLITRPISVPRLRLLPSRPPRPPFVRQCPSDATDRMLIKMKADLRAPALPPFFRPSSALLLPAPRRSFRDLSRLIGNNLALHVLATSAP
jgi:hypothetical protein